MAINDLREYGLSNKESKVYLALLELGPSSVTQIASKSSINRTTAYDILNALEHYGLISHVGEYKKQTYVAENPERLISYLDKKSQEYKNKAGEAKGLLPELKGMFNLITRKPIVKYYEGEEGILAIYEDSLSSKTEILSWLNTENTADFAFDYFQDYYKRRAKKGIHIKAIYNDSPLSKETLERDKTEDRESRIIPQEMMDIGPECYIYDDKVAYMSLKERFGVIIESRDIAEAQRKLYDLAWRSAKELKVK